MRKEYFKGSGESGPLESGDSRGAPVEHQSIVGLFHAIVNSGKWEDGTF